MKQHGYFITGLIATLCFIAVLTGMYQVTGNKPKLTINNPFSVYNTSQVEEGYFDWYNATSQEKLIFLDFETRNMLADNLSTENQLVLANRLERCVDKTLSEKDLYLHDVVKLCKREIK